MYETGIPGVYTIHQNRTAMNIRKQFTDDLEHKRGLFFRIGLVVSTGLALLAFDWTTSREAPPFPPEPPDIVDPPVDFVITTHTTTPPAPPAASGTPKPSPVPPKPVPNPSPPAPDPPLPIEPRPEPEPGPDPVYVPAPKPVFIAAVMPSFPGGEAALIRYIQDHLRYPAEAIMDGMQGTVYIRFVVDREGKVVDAELVRGLRGDMDRAALKVVAGMPDWNPGMNNGHPVAVIQTLPIDFRLLRE